MNLKETLKRDSLLNISLNALSRVLQRAIGLNSLITVTNDRFKAIEAIVAERQALLNNGKITSIYPYGYLVVNELALRKDYVQNVTAMRRHGLQVQGADETVGGTLKAFLFPLRLGVELHYLTGDNQDAFLTAQALLLLGAIKGLSFKITLHNLQWNTFIEFPDSTTVPLGEAENTQQPNGIELNLAFSMTTMTGFFKGAAAVQSSAPDLNVDVQVQFNNQTSDEFTFSYGSKTPADE